MPDPGAPPPALPGDAESHPVGNAEPPSPGAGDAGRPPTRPWGAWATAGLAAAILVVYTALQLLAGGGLGAALAARSGVAPTRAELARLLDSHFGLVLWVSLVVAAPLAAAATALAAGIRRPPSLTAELGLVRPRWRPALAWLAVTLAFTFAYDALSAALDRPVVPEYLERAYRTAAFLPSLVVAVVVAAPLFEELLFRGFLYAGLARSRLGPRGAIAVTAAVFAAIHIQYDLLDMTAILGLGLILGAARWRTGSTLLTLGLHAAVNLAAMVEMVWILQG